jgi:hypothetical protein
MGSIDITAERGRDPARAEGRRDHQLSRRRIEHSSALDD